jgi:hypothetical protein
MEAPFKPTAATEQRPIVFGRSGRSVSRWRSVPQPAADGGSIAANDVARSAGAHEHHEDATRRQIVVDNPARLYGFNA